MFCFGEEKVVENFSWDTLCQENGAYFLRFAEMRIAA